VTTDELTDPHSLGIRCKVNNVVKQDSNTNQLVFNTDQVVSWCSKFMPLFPGDVILTGTPPGVGVFMKPPQFLKVKEHSNANLKFIYCRKGMWWNARSIKSEKSSTKSSDKEIN